MNHLRPIGLIVLATALGGCVHDIRPTPNRGAAVGSQPATLPVVAAPTDPQLTALLALRAELEAKLDEVQKELLRAATRATPPEEASEAVPAAVRRVRLIVALTKIDRAVADHRFALEQIPADADQVTTRAEKPDPSRVAALLEDARDEIAAADRFHRKSTKRPSGKTSSPHKGKRPGDAGESGADDGWWAALDDDGDPQYWRAQTTNSPGPPLGAPEAAVVRSSSPPPGVMPAVHQHLGSMLRCFPDDLRQEGVQLRVKARFAADGQFHDPRISSTDALAPRVEACIVGVLASIRATPPNDGSSHVVAFPLWLASDS